MSTARPDTNALDIDMPPAVLPEAARQTALLLEIDLDAALYSFCGRVDLYEHVLRGVARDSVNLPVQINSLLAQGQRHDARRALHTFKGLVGTVGWKRVWQQAFDAEKAIGDNAPDAAERLTALVSALQAGQPQVFALLGVLRPLAREHAAAVAAQSAPRPQPAGEMLGRTQDAGKA